ncbi:hypothetical protein PoB_004395300 [Plakobranchus ocellatus]|uniref:Secreted protein n=1 Tax=Plakobranchus ocellatus TaxID=259542 RepID=A0AAV4BE37_9GAST|nr:hypothetical protein PoB_004395300 [Plakobranchus ocellatus]
MSYLLRTSLFVLLIAKAGKNISPNVTVTKFCLGLLCVLCLGQAEGEKADCHSRKRRREREKPVSIPQTQVNNADPSAAVVLLLEDQLICAIVDMIHKTCVSDDYPMLNNHLV